jgi:predicted dehydrogenase
MEPSSSRRTFIKTASAGAIAMTLSASSYARVVGANERISIGVVGCGGRGAKAHMPGVHRWAKQENIEITAVADPWRLRREEAAAQVNQWYGRPARSFVSYRHIMELKDVDAVMIASPDHHHPMHLKAAAEAKKDAYVEKPLAMDMPSLLGCCDAAKAAGIVVQMGTQVRSFPTSTGCRDLYKTGILGKVARIEQCRNGSKPYWYHFAERTAKKEDVDWGEFLMDRPMRPFRSDLLTGWYGYRDFSDGPIANLGCHFVDLMHYITGAKYPTSAVALGGTFTWKDEHQFTCADHAQAMWIYPEGFMVSYSSNFGNAGGNTLRIYGDEGVMNLTNWQKPTVSGEGAGKPGKATKEVPVEPVETPDHFLDWLQCLRTRNACNAPLEAGYQHGVTVILAMRAFDTGRRQIYDHEKREIREG